MRSRGTSGNFLAGTATWIDHPGLLQRLKKMLILFQMPALPVNLTIPEQAKRLQCPHDVICHSRHLTLCVQIIETQQPTATGMFCHQITTDCRHQ
jgi:hypothetical protein